MSSTESETQRRRAPREFGADGDALLAEHAVEALLRRHRCRFERDVPLPSGRTADFRVTRGSATTYLHVKWLSAPGGSERIGPIPRELRALESIERAIDVAVRWRPGAGCSAFRKMVRDVTPFLRAAHVSEEHVVRDARGREIGAIRVLGPVPRGSSVRLIDARVAARQAAQSLRAVRLLRKAYDQFMPRAANAIVIVSADPLDAGALESALLGSVIERWDRFPARGERVAHGRGDDGFWSPGTSSASRAVAWLRAGDGEASATRRAAALRLHGVRAAARKALRLRAGATTPPPVTALLRELFRGDES